MTETSAAYLPTPDPSDVEGNLKQLLDQGQMSPSDYDLAMADIQRIRQGIGTRTVRRESVMICGIPTTFAYPTSFRAGLLISKLYSLAKGSLSVNLSDDAGQISMDFADVIEPLLDYCFPDLARDPGIKYLHLDAVAECLQVFGRPEVRQEVEKIRKPK